MNNFNPYDYIRVVNIRGDKEFQANEDEKIIVGHRDNPLLGNKNIMKKRTFSERQRVIAEHKKDLEKDLLNKGPIYVFLKSIAKEIVEKKQKFALQCFCSPAHCHNDNYIPVVIKMVNNLIEENNIKNIIKKKI